ncbi:hypothetical protein X977_2960 [Burkholderia pseudomallei MSHR7504]|nr:hypothetical protein X977_2960 [Burkholderia pseudomallei MSHR7504]
MEEDCLNRRKVLLPHRQAGIWSILERRGLFAICRGLFRQLCKFGRNLVRRTIDCPVRTASRHLHHCLDVVCIELVVVVKKSQPFPGGERKPQIPGGTPAYRHARRLIADIKAPCKFAFDHRAAIRLAVLDDNDFDTRIGLMRQRHQRLPQQCRSAMRSHDDRDKRHRARVEFLDREGKKCAVASVTISPKTKTGAKTAFAIPCPRAPEVGCAPKISSQCHQMRAPRMREARRPREFGNPAT